MKKLIVLAVFSISLFSCGSNCITCSNATTGDSFEACEDSDISYTDINGNAVPFESLASAWSSQGYDCE